MMAGESDGVSPARWAFREAAAVLAVFEPLRLRPFGAGGGDAMDVLYDDCDVVEDGPAAGLWSLRDEVRQVALLRLSGREELRAALAANPANPDRPRHRMQQVMDAIILGRRPDYARADTETLACMLSACRWLRGAIPDLPDEETLLHLLDQSVLFAPFRASANEHFRGRKAELARLRSFVGLHEESLFDRARRGIRSLLGETRGGALLITGPGGIGKSALLSRFVLEHFRLGETRIPFAYLDLDDPGNRVEEPITLLREAARQLSIEWPEHSAPLLAIKRACEEALAERRKRAERDGRVSWQDVPYLDSYAAFEERQLADLALVLREIGLPFLFVIDTFEEAQYRTRGDLKRLIAFLARFERAFPALRVVISGRADVPGFEAVPLPLTELDADSARAVMESHGIEPALARRIVEKVGTVPLSLHLAASVVRTGGESALDGLSSGGLFFRQGPAMIQGVLYRRILEHIHHDDVRALAHPGLVVRRVTPGVIAEVLARPCGVTLKDATRAASLCDELGREVWLVTRDADGALIHRADVRRMMLAPLQSDRPEQVQAIHEAAVTYYQSQVGSIARAEELYHRLARNEDRSILEGRWTDECGERLRASIDELPPRAQAYLAARIGISRTDEIWREADLADFERYAEAEVRLLAANRAWKEALALLALRTDRSPNSPLLFAEALVQHGMGRKETAMNALHRATREAEQEGDRARLLDLRLLGVQMGVAHGNDAAAAGALDEALDLAPDDDAELRVVETLVGQAEQARIGPELQGRLDALVKEGGLKLQQRDAKLFRRAENINQVRSGHANAKSIDLGDMVDWRPPPASAPQAERAAAPPAVQAAGGAPRGDAGPTIELDRERLLEQLDALLPAQFEEVAYRLNVPQQYLSTTAAQVTRAVELIRFLDGQGQLGRLDATLRRMKK